MINKVILVGNLGRDPEIRTLDNGVKVGKFSIATNENYKDNAGNWQTNTEWHDVVVWRYLAESAEKNLKKGSQAYVEGKLTHRKWQDQNGNDRYTTEVVAAVCRSLDRRESSGGGYQDAAFPTQEPANNPTRYADNSGTSGNAPQNPVQNNTPTVQGNTPSTNSEPQIPDPDDDLPF